MRTIAIVQARLGSRRLPEKMLMDLAGRPALERMLRRVARSKEIHQIVVATSTLARDAAILDLARALGLEGHAGSETDVLDRVYQAARERGAEIVVRLTGDCPLHDPEIIDAVVRMLVKSEGGADYASNVMPPTFPDGLDTEVLPFSVLERLWNLAKEPSDREHVTTYLRTRPREFRILNLAHEVDLSNMRWTLDDANDLAFLRAVYEAFDGRDDFGWREVLDLVRRSPALHREGPAAARNLGWLESAMREQKAAKLKIDRSNELWKRAQALIPAGTQTLSKGPTQFVDGVAPKYLVRGRGSHVWDVDGNEFIDYPMALGPVTLGHCHPVTQEAVRRQLEEGVTFSLMHPLEIEVAEILHEVIPCADRVRFGKNGSDATAAAVRCARAYTGRDMVAHCGYHGWQDWYIGSVGGLRAKGVPEAVRQLQCSFAYNNLASLERIFEEHTGKIAAVIMEVMTIQEPQAGFLEGVAALARRNGAVLVFDEIISGFRHHLGGLQQHFGVTPDLAAVGKGMANGLPISAVVGRAEIMREFEDIFFSFTFGGECLSLAAAKATLQFMRREPVVEHFWRQGAKLQKAFGEMVVRFGMEGYTACRGLPPWTICTFFDHAGQEALAMKSLFQQEMLKRGVLFSGSQFVCYEHTDADIQRTIEAYEAAFSVLSFGVGNRCVEQLLEGRRVEPVFRRV